MYVSLEINFGFLEGELGEVYFYLVISAIPLVFEISTIFLVRVYRQKAKKNAFSRRYDLIAYIGLAISIISIVIATGGILFIWMMRDFTIYI